MNQKARTFGQMELLLHCSQQLWSESSYKALVKKFMGLLVSDFDASHCSYLVANVTPNRQKITELLPGEVRLPGLAPLDERFTNELRQQLGDAFADFLREAPQAQAESTVVGAGEATPRETGHELTEGYLSFICGNETIYVAILSELQTQAQAQIESVANAIGGSGNGSNASDLTQEQTSPANQIGLIAWRLSPLAAKAFAAKTGVSTAAAAEIQGATIDFLTRQIQSESRWFRKLDNAQSQLYRDDLTGLFNYRYLDVALDSELRRVHRFHTSFCLLFIDLDNFKEVNDQHGHLAGSSVLRQVSGRLRDALREVDTIIRYGGDEYVVLLLGATSAAGILAAERIRHRVSNRPFVIENSKTIEITASIGVCACPAHGGDKEALLRLADEAMYKSKRSGKNRVTLVGENASQNNMPTTNPTAES